MKVAAPQKRGGQVAPGIGSDGGTGRIDLILQRRPALNEFAHDADGDLFGRFGRNTGPDGRVDGMNN